MSQSSASPRPTTLPQMADQSFEWFEKLKQTYTNGLRENFALDPLNGCVVLVEGVTDIEYLTAAADKVRNELGHDLLDASPLYGADARITITTPGTPKHPDPSKKHTGGTKQLGRLIQFLSGYRALFESSSRLCIVVDHDQAGRDILKTLNDNAFADEYMGLSHDPAHHHFACSNSDVVVEDLLSLKIQEAFFGSGRSCCRVTYTEGVRTRFQWDMPSKDQLPVFVREHGSWEDVQEMARVLVRVRSLWSLPCPDITFRQLSA